MNKKALIIAVAFIVCALAVVFFLRLREERNGAAARLLVSSDQPRVRLRELTFDGQRRKIVLKETKGLRYIVEALSRSKKHVTNGGLTYQATFTVDGGQQVVCGITVRLDGKELVLMVPAGDENTGDPISFGLELIGDIPPSLAKTIDYLLRENSLLSENNVIIE